MFLLRRRGEGREGREREGKEGGRRRREGGGVGRRGGVGEGLHLFDACRVATATEKQHLVKK